MLKLNEGDRVRIADRAPTNADAKNGLFYNYYRNLSGTVFKVYGKGDTAQAAIDVDLESLPSDVASRHQEMRSAMQAEEGRRRPAADYDFRLRYVILVSVADVTRLRK